MAERENLLTVAQVAEILGVNPKTVKRWIQAGKLHGVWLGSDRVGWRVRPSEVDALIATGELRHEQPRLELDAPKLAA